MDKLADLHVLHFICLSSLLIIIPALLFLFLPSNLIFSIILSTFVLLTHSLTLSPLLMSHISVPIPFSLSSPARCLIHIQSVYTSCCSSLSSHAPTLTSSSWFLPLFQLCSSLSLSLIPSLSSFLLLPLSPSSCAS